MIDIMSAYEGIKAALDIVQGVSAVSTQTEINQAKIDIQSLLLDAQTAAINDKQLISRLTDEIAIMKRQLNALDAWEAEKTRYVLTQSEVGTFTYELRQEFAGGQVHHRLCVTCFENQRKSILHGVHFAECHTCNKTIHTKRDLHINRPHRVV